MKVLAALAIYFYIVKIAEHCVMTTFIFVHVNDNYRVVFDLYNEGIILLVDFRAFLRLK